MLNPRIQSRSRAQTRTTTHAHSYREPRLTKYTVGGEASSQSAGEGITRATEQTNAIFTRMLDQEERRAQAFKMAKTATFHCGGCKTTLSIRNCLVPERAAKKIHHKQSMSGEAAYQASPRHRGASHLDTNRD